MSLYALKIEKVSNEVLKITIGRGGYSVTAHVSGDELAKLILEKGNLGEDLKPSKPMKESFKE